MAEKTENENPAKPEFRMQKMYIKDLSFENPNAPEVFTNRQKTDPAVEVNLQLNNKQIDADHWEVALQITAKVSSKVEVSCSLELPMTALVSCSGISSTSSSEIG